MKTVRIGNGCGFWGDNLDAPILLARDGRLNYLTLEYLAELTMSILALQKGRDPQHGFAHDFIDVLRRLCPILSKQENVKIVTNAGGMNPAACAENAREILNNAGLNRRKIATVTGDDLLPRLDQLLESGIQFENLDTAEPFENVREKVVSANAYLGARPIVEALQRGADIVITGRVADASLSVAPAVYELGWPFDDWDRLSAATVAGHLIECGAQVTGGLWCNWQQCNDLADVGYPIAELREDATLQITKPPKSGGVVNAETVSEQLLYEVGDPSEYITPDVVADFTSVELEESGEDAVEVRHASGKPATGSYKVSMAYRDGFAASGTLLIFGDNAARKAEACAEIMLKRLERAGISLEQTCVESLGAGSCVPISGLRDDLSEVVLRVAARDHDRDKVSRFAKEFAPLVTSGPPGVTGYTTGRPAVREVFAYWPALIPKDAVQPEVRIYE